MSELMYSVENCVVSLKKCLVMPVMLSYLAGKWLHVLVYQICNKHNLEMLSSGKIYGNI